VRAHKANSMHLRTLSPLCPRRPHHRTRTRNSTTPPGPESDHPNLTCRPRKPLCRRCSRRVSEQRIAANWAPGPPRKRSAQSLRADAGIMCVSRRAHLACRRARAIAISVVAGEARGSTPQAARGALYVARRSLCAREDRWQNHNHKTKKHRTDFLGQIVRLQIYSRSRPSRERGLRKRTSYRSDLAKMSGHSGTDW